FTASPEKADEILVLSDTTRHNQNITEIGEIVEGNKLILVDSEGEEQPLSGDGYNHFAPD
ncbi:MAG: thiamine-phosphate kinase, partial [Gammaproteobacteria bacterium]